MFHLSGLDFLVIAFYFALVIGIGFVMRKRAARGVDSYFLAGRRLAWWWVGTSIVATTFSADTPLAVAGITATQGIAGNWFWWSWVLSYMAVTVFFAKRWRRTHALTDVELTEMRYGGRSAASLRLVKAFYLSVVMNSVILGWVFRSLTKIFSPFIRWEEIAGPGFYHAFIAIWPSSLILDTPDATLTLLVSLGVILIYSSMGGIQSGVVNDLIQFTMAMGGSILLAVMAVRHAGGMDHVMQSVNLVDPSLLSFFPDFTKMSITAFLVYFFVQWWAQYFSDGTGYIAQRINTSRSERDALLGSLWFNIANYALRTWPWVIVGLVGLALYPPGSDACQSAAGALVCADRETAYPVLIHEVLSPYAGSVGFMLAGLLAAFMSTADTHINWGASYLVNDVYLRFVRPQARRAEQMIVSRLFVLGIAIVGLLVATRTESIAGAWKFLLAMAAGLGLPQLLRWFWWRANAWTEMAGMASSLALSLVLYRAYPDALPEHILFFVATGSGAFAILITLLTPPVDEMRLVEFFRRVRPAGLWSSVIRDEAGRADALLLAGVGEQTPIPRTYPFTRYLTLWLVASAAVLAMMFAIGFVIFGRYVEAVAAALLMVASGWPALRAFLREE